MYKKTFLMNRVVSNSYASEFFFVPNSGEHLGVCVGGLFALFSVPEDVVKIWATLSTHKLHKNSVRVEDAYGATGLFVNGRFIHTLRDTRDTVRFLRRMANVKWVTIYY